MPQSRCGSNARQRSRNRVGGEQEVQEIREFISTIVPDVDDRSAAIYFQRRTNRPE